MLPSPPPLVLGLDVDAPVEVVWDLLVHVGQWPRWGPTVSRASVDGGRVRISAGATGTVRTTVGVTLPFRVERWQDSGPVREWSWRVAGMPATAHTVSSHGGGCRVELSAPWWAAGYVPVLWLALRRIRSLSQAPRFGGGTRG